METVQSIIQPEAKLVYPQRFLRLAGDRGWVVENHPKVSVKERLLSSHVFDLRNNCVRICVTTDSSFTGQLRDLD